MSKKVCSFFCLMPESHSLNFGEKSLQHDAWKKKLEKAVVKVIEEQEGKHFISGMSNDADMCFAEAVIALRNDYPRIELEVVLPYEEHTSEWIEEERDRYFSIVEKSDKETLLAKRFTEDCLQKHSQYIVDCADTIILLQSKGIIDKQELSEYAKSKNKRILDIFDIGEI